MLFRNISHQELHLNFMRKYTCSEPENTPTSLGGLDLRLTEQGIRFRLVEDMEKMSC